MEEFFMAASHKDLVKNVVSASGFAVFKEALEFLLFEQYVRDGTTGALYQVTKGSGMGTSFSSDLCDLALYQLAEQYIVNADTFASLKIKMWLRYRDDIFVVGNRDGCIELFNRFRNRIKDVWKVKVEVVTQTSLDFLDLQIFVAKNHIGQQVLMHKPYSRPTKVFCPLCTDSAHMRSVHAWPVSEVRRLAMNSSSPAIFSGCFDQVRRQFNLPENGRRHDC